MVSLTSDRRWSRADLPLRIATNGVLWRFIWWIALPAFFGLITVLGWNWRGLAAPLVPLGLAALVGWLALTARRYHRATLIVTTESVEVARGKKSVVDRIADCSGFTYTSYNIVWTNSSDRMRPDRCIPGLQFGLTRDETRHLANLLNRLREAPDGSQS
jgi:hypothetical protein